MTGKEKKWRECEPLINKAMLTCKVNAPEEEDKLDEETPRRFQSVVSVGHLEKRVELIDVLQLP